jgi:hypothetical protein
VGRDGPIPCGAAVIHYHGTPITPAKTAHALLKSRHACVSFEDSRDVALAAEVCQSFILDNGAFSLWKAGAGTVDVDAFAAWVREWCRHPGFDWCLIPDVIDGDEVANDAMLSRWRETGLWAHGVPVWHLHESTERLQRLAHGFPRVALGSSGAFATIGTPEWWDRMAEAMAAVCDSDGRPRCKLHGLRMLNPTVFSQLPLASADSTNVARNIGIDGAWDRAPYAPRSKSVRALILADRIEHHASAATWQRTRGTDFNGELFG